MTDENTDLLRDQLSRTPDDVDLLVGLAQTLLARLDLDAAPGTSDEPAALLHAALDAVGEELTGRAMINADLADVHVWRCYAALRHPGAGHDPEVERDKAIASWKLAAAAATEAGVFTELVASSPVTVIDQVELLTGRAIDTGEDADFTDAIELAGFLVDALPAGAQDRLAALFSRALAHASRYDRRPSEVDDLRAAVRDLRAVWRDVDEDHPLYVPVAGWLGLVLAARGQHDDGDFTDTMAEAVAQLEIATRLTTDPEAPLFTVVRIHLAVLRAVRYLYFAAPTEVRDAAVAEFRALLVAAADDSTDADVCHLGLGLLTLADGAPPARRQRLVPGEVALHRHPDTDGTARRHLDRLTKGARANLLPGFGPDPTVESTQDQVVESVALFGTGHAMRDVMLTLLGRTTRSPEVSGEALALVERALRVVPDDHPQRDLMIAVLATSAAHFFGTAEEAAVDAVRALLTDMVARPAEDLVTDVANNYLLALVDAVRGVVEQDADLMTAGMRRMRWAAERAPDGHWLGDRVGDMVSSLMHLRWIAGAELDYLYAAMYHNAARAMPGAEKDVPAADRIDLLSTSLLAQITASSSQISPALMAGTISDIEREGARLPQDHAKRWEADVIAGLARLHLGGREHGIHSAAARAGLAGLGRVTRTMPGLDHNDAYATAVRGSFRITTAFASRDLAEMDRGIADLAGASASMPLEPREQGVVLSRLGLAFCLRFQLTTRTRDISIGIDRLEEAARVFRHQDGGVFAALNTITLAEAYHLRDDDALHDRERAIATGLDALREQARDVHVQASTRHAVDKVAAVTGDAVKVARWCLGGVAPAAAVTALELGRAMVVQVATRDSSVPAELRARGAHDLASEWEDTEDDSGTPWDLPLAELVRGIPPQLSPATLPVPDDLRRRVSRVLGSEPDPPTVAEIAETLRDNDTSALVYLLSGGKARTGTALVVDSRGCLTELVLPGLNTASAGLVTDFRGVRDDLAGTAPGTPAWQRMCGLVDDMCDWSWTSAMERVLDAVQDGAQHHPVRVVLVPVGWLAEVPWHTARRTVAGGRPRYLCQDLVVTYAASARQFVDAARRPTRPWHSAPGLVRVAESTLYWASRELAVIRDRCYPKATYLGGRGRGARAGHPPATIDNVRAMLPGPDGPGVSMIHFGCHAHLADPPIESYLSLSDGRLPVGDMLDQARRRPVGVPGALVVLAACTSDASDALPDESLSLATAFLTAGASGVVGARWAVADAPTAVFMIMFHHYLSSGYPNPAVALRATQVWMIEGGGRLPTGFDPVLADEITRLDLTRVEHWGAFTYQGR